MQPKSTQIGPGMTRSLLSRCGFYAEKKASRWYALTLRDFAPWVPQRAEGITSTMGSHSPQKLQAERIAASA